MITSDNTQAELALDIKAELAETPVWDDREQKLYFVNIDGCEIHCFDPVTGKDVVINVGQRAGSIALRENGGLVAAFEHGFYFVDFAGGAITEIGDPEADQPGNRFNDGQCDPAGRFWAGTIEMAPPRRPIGTLYVLDTDLSIQPMLRGVTTSNGIAWSPDNRTMYYIDTRRQTVDAFDYDLTSGAISDRRPIISLPEGTGRPDGMAIDAEGMLWVAHWDGWQVGRYDPATGKQLASVHVPAAHVSSCAFGGPDLDWLYITTARGGISEADLEKQPLAGGIFRVKTGVRGLPAKRFNG